jgi:hypothetical protein
MVYEFGLVTGVAWHMKESAYPAGDGVSVRASLHVSG